MTPSVKYGGVIFIEHSVHQRIIYKKYGPYIKVIHTLTPGATLESILSVGYVPSKY